MKKLLIFFSTLILLFSCEENEVDRIILSDQIRLTGKYEDGIVTLHWNRPYVGVFDHYVILRSSSIQGNYTSIAVIEDFDSLCFIDTSMPLESVVEYEVMAFGSMNSLTSNKCIIETDFQLIDIAVSDVLIWEERNWLYLVSRENNTIYKYDFEQEIMLDSLFLEFTPEFCDIGDNGAGMELYVPGDGGVLRIYDATDFSYKDYIDAGLQISCVVTNNNGIIFLSVAPSPWWEEPLRSYNRSNKAYIDGSGDFDYTRLRIIESTNEIFEITRNIGPVDMDYYTCDQSGNFLSHLNDKQHGDYPLSPYIFRISPDGQYIITSDYGAIYSSSMTYIRQLSNYSARYNDFCFGSNSEYVYCGNYKSMVIDKYAVSEGIDPLESYSTIGYPLFLFMLEDKIVSINSKYSQSVRWDMYSYRSGILVDIIDI